LTWGGAIYIGGVVSPTLYLCDAADCTGALNILIGSVQTYGSDHWPSVFRLDGSYAITSTGASCATVGGETVEFDNLNSPGRFTNLNQTSAPFNAALPVYLVVMMYVDSTGTIFGGTPNAQMNVLRVNVLH
jgi:hypothetical protein